MVPLSQRRRAPLWALLVPALVGSAAGYSTAGGQQHAPPLTVLAEERTAAVLTGADRALDLAFDDYSTVVRLAQLQSQRASMAASLSDSSQVGSAEPYPRIK